MTDMSDEEGMELQPSKNSKASRRASIIKDGREVINTEGTKSTGENEIEEQLLVTKEQNQEFTNELDASSASKPNYEIKMKKTTEIKEKKMKRRGRQAKTIVTKEIFEEIKEPTTIQNSTNITETNIPVSPIHMSPSAIIASSSCTTALKSSSMAVQSSSSARVATNPPTKTAQNTAKSSAIATGISSGALRVLGSAGLKGSSLPLVLSMSGTSTAGGLSLLPAGLPPGRYVILPSSTSSVPSVTSISATMTQSEMKTETPIATTASLKQVTSASLFPSISTSPSVVQRPTTYFTGRVGRPARGSIQRSSLRRGTLHSGYSIRGRRKSYTAAEKLAMIEAVESGQKKSVVADQFGVAPSTLACILLQKHKIRCDQATDLTRRRLRRPRLSSGIYSHSSEIHEDSKDPRDDCNNDLSFGSHFLSPLSPSRENLFDQELPEEIISVPDLSDRVSMDSSGMVKSENISVGYTCTPMVTEDSNNPSGSGQRLQDNRGGFYNQYNLDHANMDVKPEPIFGIHSEVDEEHAMSNAGTSNHSSPSPRHPSPSPQGLTGPYLLKKETHCNTILDELLRDETYTDVTLTAEGQTIKAHRIILSLSSKYFKTVLSTDANAKNVIVFRDMKFQELKDIIGFIYTGEVTVDASDLDSFMKTADILEVTSLCNSQKNFPKGFNLSSSTVSDHELPKQPSLKRSNPNISQSPPSKARKASAGTESTTGTKQSKRSIKHLPSPVISPPVATPSASINDPSQTNDEPSEDDLPEPVVVQADCILRDLDEPEQSLDPAPSNECCAACSSTFEDVDGLFQHLEEFHNNQDLFPCEVCVRIFLTAKSFNKHRNYCKPKMKTSE